MDQKVKLIDSLIKSREKFEEELRQTNKTYHKYEETRNRIVAEIERIDNRLDILLRTNNG